MIDIDCIKYIIKQKELQRDAAKSCSEAERIGREIKALISVIE